MSRRLAVRRVRFGERWRVLGAGVVVLVAMGPLTSATALSAHASPRHEGGNAAIRAATTSPPGYLTLMIGRGLYSKATSACQTPTGMVTLDQVVPQLYAGSIPNEPVTRPGLTLTANVIPDRTLAATTKCLSQNLYPSWSDLSNLSSNYGLAAVSASQSYANMTTLTTQQQIQQSCGSLSSFISNGFHRAWGLFAYPDNHYSTAIQSSVVDNCFAVGRTYVKPSAAGVTNQESAMVTPWLQKTVDVGGGRCHTSTLPCSTYHSSTLGLYASPLTLAGLTNVAAGNWTTLQTYTFVTGVSTSGPIQWDCSEPLANNGWKAHWTSLFEVYCWNDYLYALSLIPSNVVVTDPATVAEAWGRIPTPYVAVSSANPSTLNSASQSTTISWSSWENGAYSVEVGGAECTTGTQVGQGSYATSPSTATVVVPGSDFSPGTNTVRICLTNDAGHLGSATTSVSYLAAPSVNNVSPAVGPLAPGTQVTITGSNFTSDAAVSVDGASAGSVVVNSSTSISATLPSPPPDGAGTYDVIVTQADGTSQPNPPGDAFTYEGAPTVASVSPNGGPAAGGGPPITITGTNFSQGDPSLWVSFGGTPGMDATVASTTTLTVVAPAGTASSTVEIQVTDAGGTSPLAPPGDQYSYGT
jgi:hypothetical protein